MKLVNYIYGNEKHLTISDLRCQLLLDCLDLNDHLARKNAVATWLLASKDYLNQETYKDFYKNLKVSEDLADKSKAKIIQERAESLIKPYTSKTIDISEIFINILKVLTGLTISSNSKNDSVSKTNFFNNKFDSTLKTSYFPSVLNSVNGKKFSELTSEELHTLQVLMLLSKTRFVYAENNIRLKTLPALSDVFITYAQQFMSSLELDYESVPGYLRKLKVDCYEKPSIYEDMMKFIAPFVLKETQGSLVPNYFCGFPVSDVKIICYLKGDIGEILYNRYAQYPGERSPLYWDMDTEGNASTRQINKIFEQCPDIQSFLTDFRLFPTS